ncbi:MAG: transporter substrate-binding domain-containing protein [Synergistaceae bacterium]|nr:transporter substrate-binding domain-containing protein [Synergistaceae bacterium]
MMKKFIARFLLLTAIIMLLASTAFAAVNGVADLKSAKVGVEAGSVSELSVRDVLKDNRENIFTYDSVEALVTALRDKKIDAAVLDETPARYFAINYDDLRILPEALQTYLMGIAFKKGNALCNDVNKALTELKDDGTLARIIANNMHSESNPEDIDLNKDAKNGKLWVGCSAVFPPYEVRTEKGFAGIDVELSAAIAKKLDKELVMVDYRFDLLPEALETGRIDMICSAFTISEARSEFMDFTDPYDADQEVILVLADK